MSLISRKSSIMDPGISGRGKASRASNMSLYIKNIITKKLSIPIKYVGANIKQVLEEILKKEFEGKCCIDGYVKKGSSKIITYSCGNINGNVAIFTIVFEYLVCNPPNGMRISCVVSNITNAGLMAFANNSDISPINVFIARDHHYNIPYFSELKADDVVMVRVIGQRFELNDSAVFIIAELEEQLERGEGGEGEVELSKSKRNIKKSTEEREGEGEEEEQPPKAGPAKSPLSIIAEESQGMMNSLFPSKSSEEEGSEKKEESEEEGSEEEGSEKKEGSEEEGSEKKEGSEDEE
jgi:DNA-directed RNA polymerase subunit E'/Rpb7